MANFSAFTLFVLLTIAMVLEARVTTHPTVPARTSIANGVLLRVLPLGDSITFGAPVEPFNGYRKELLDKLVGRGNVVDYVGSTVSGTFSNNQHEGHRGKIIDEIAQESSVGIWATPNIVLIHAGTNDINRNIDVDNAPNRLSDLIGLVFEHSPKAAVFVAQIVPTKTESSTARVQAYNNAIAGVVNTWVAKGKLITTVDIFSVVNPITDLADDLHPNFKGYTKMAQQWYNAITIADEKGWIVEAGKSQAPRVGVGSDCGANGKWKSRGEIALGPKAANGNAPFKQEWEPPITFSLHECDPSRLFFPDLDGDGYGDWACVGDIGDVLAFLQKPANGRPVNNWAAQGTIATGKDGRNGNWVFFADLDGDGKSDYVYVESGSIYAWINKGLSGDSWIWEPLGKINVNDVGATPENVQMVDIDGDGRADLLLVDNDTGAVTAWLNGGSSAMPNWQKIGVVATGASKTVNDIVILGDFTGNGVADYMLVGKNGKVTGLANFMQERSFIPRWAPKVTIAEGPEGATQQYVRLMDVNGDGKADYLLYDKNGGSRLWLNAGKGGKWQVGDGVFLADLNGDGVRDYIWSDGSMNILGYLGDGLASNNWKNEGQVKRTDRPWDLRHLRMAVITNSKRPDIVMVENVQGACQWSQNLGRSKSGSYGWGTVGVLAKGPKHTVIAAPYNWRWDSTRVHFADLTGDGLDDYLYINTNGAVLMWKNLGTIPPSWGTAQLVAAGPQKGVWGTEIQFGDTDGDGKMDYVHVDRVSGAAEVWRNLGFREDGSINWAPPTPWAQSIGDGVAGYNIRVVDMTNDGRADIVSVDPHTGGLTLWENSCPASTSSDPPTPDPTIPDDPEDTESLECDPSDPEPGCVIGYPIGPCWDGHKYHTIDDVDRGRADFPEHCVNTYLLNALSETMNAALEKFDDIMSSNYKARYNAFVSMVRGQTSNSWDEIRTLSDTYWDCYDMVSGEKQSITCLGTFHTAELWEPKDGFCDMLEEDYQFDCSLISYPKTTVSENDFCNPRGICTTHDRTVYYPKYDRDFDVPDPADSITKSLEMYRDYSDWLSSVSAATQIGQFEESEGDVVDASVITVLSVQAAADAMEAVSEEGEDAIEEKRKRTIVAFVTAFLLLIPGVGEVAGAGLAVARLGRLAAVVDVAGNSALGIYSIVEDPGNSPGEVVALIFGVLAVRSNFGWGKAAHKARRIDDVVFNKLGDSVSSGVKKARGLINQCGEA